MADKGGSYPVLVFTNEQGENLHYVNLFETEIGGRRLAVLMREERIAPFLDDEVDEPDFESFEVADGNYVRIEDEALLAQLEAAFQARMQADAENAETAAPPRPKKR